MLWAEDGIMYEYTCTDRQGLRKKLRKWSRTITGSTSSNSSSSGHSEDRLYTAIVATASIVTAAGSPAAVPQAGLSPTSRRSTSNWNDNEMQFPAQIVAATMATVFPAAAESVTTSSNRRSLSSTIRNFFGESSSSLASSSRSNRLSTHVEADTRMSDLEESNDQVPVEGPIRMAYIEEESVEMADVDGGDSSSAASKDMESSDFLQIPKLRSQTSLQSISTIDSAVSCVGFWDKSTEVHTPITEFGAEDDDHYKNLPPITAVGAENDDLLEILSQNYTICSSPSGKVGDQSVIANATVRAVDPLKFFSSMPELIDIILGYFDSPYEVMQLQKVSNYWLSLLRSYEAYHSFIHRHYSVRPGPGEIQRTRNIGDLERVAGRDIAIKRGRLAPIAQIIIPINGPRARYHSGYACFNQRDRGIEQKGYQSIVVYDLKRLRATQRVDPTTFPCNFGSKISCVVLGGVANGVHLVYCETDDMFRARIICYDLPGRSEQPKWQYPIPSHLTSFVGDQAIIQTNDFITVLALNGRILAWDENGNMIGNEPLHQKQADFQSRKAGQIYLSNERIYMVTWCSHEPSWLSVYSNRNLEIIAAYPLDDCTAVRNISGFFSRGRLFLAVARHVLVSSGICSWSMLCIDDNRPESFEMQYDFPVLGGMADAAFVYYPHHGRTYKIGHSSHDFRSLRPTTMLSLVNNATGLSECLVQQEGYTTALSLDGVCQSLSPLQGDDEFMVWCTMGAMEVFKFDHRYGVH